MTNTTNLAPIKTQAYLFINGAYRSGIVMIYKNNKWEQVIVNIRTKLSPNIT